MTATPLPSDELGGRLLGGRYRVKTLRGRGGMGAVWVAFDEQEQKDVAIKVVRAALLEDAQAMGRFKREARVIRGLDHPGIVRSLDAGEDAGLLWIAMELLEGKTLRERLDAQGRMTWEESLACARQILRALEAAHKAGVVHRDMKPANVMLLPDGSIKLLDFGVAKQSHLDASLASSMTGTGFIVGTPGYVAPEVVLEGRNDDPRTDLYAFGVVWFEMLTGQKPFTAKTPFALAMRHAHEPAPRPSSLLPFSPIPLAVENLVSALMAKSPEERPPSAGAVLDLIAAIERGAKDAASGTPTPAALEKTETDLREVPATTAVAPIKLTPTPATMLSTPPPPTPGAPPWDARTRQRPSWPRRIVGSLVLLLFVPLGAWTFVRLVREQISQPIEVEATLTVRDTPAVSAVEAGRSPARPPGISPPPPQAQEEERNANPEAPASLPADVPVTVAVEPAPAPPPHSTRAPRRTPGVEAPPPAPPAAPPPPPSPQFSEQRIRFKITPPSSVSIDGQTPVDGTVQHNLSPGQHTLRFTKNGATLVIDVKPGDCVGYKIKLEEAAAVITEKTNPCS